MSVQARCSCGNQRFELEGPPIITTECYCNSCRSAATILEGRFGGQKVMTDDGATPFVLYKKSKVRAECRSNLLEFRLTPESPTRRIVAGCCGTPMFLEFERGHWLSVYAHSLEPDTRLTVEERTMLGDMPDDWTPPRDGVRNSNRQSATFFARLLWAWVTMGFRAPKLDWVSGRLEPD